MSKSSHTEAEIIEALKQVEAGRNAADVGGSMEYQNTQSMPGKQNTAG